MGLQKPLSKLATKHAKAQNPEVWSLDPAKVSIMAANGPTKQVCGMKLTSTNVEFGYLQCFDNETCKQFVEIKYSLHGSTLEQNFTVYYLNRNFPGDITLK